MWWRRLTLSLAVGSLCALTAVDGFAQTADTTRKQMTATAIDGAAMRFDGRLDDEVWQSAQWISDFVQKEPNEGTIPDELTEVAVVYDERFLYIGARMEMKKPETMRLELNRRDNPGGAEQMIVSLDTYCDRRTCYDFGISAAGVRFDRYHPVDDEYWREPSYDPVWDARTDVNGGGWTAEMRIPFSQLRFNNRHEQVWGINFNRWIPQRNEDNFWIAVPKNETGWSSRFGNLIGLQGIAPSRRLELLPYAAGDGEFVSNAPGDHPFRDGSDFDSRLGTDLKMGLGPNLTLDATVNPDFGQVEADPAVVNLSAYEVSFTEKRPFFIEGSQLFAPIGPSYFYSRRIGGSPHGSGLADGDYTDEPSNTTILGAAKITGRLSSGTSVGVLTALTSRERARTLDTATATDPAVHGRTEIEPVTGYGVLRLQQEFGAEKSVAGVMFTGLQRDLDEDSPLSELMRKRAYTGNSDWKLRFAKGKYQLSGHAGFSHVAGDTAIIRRTQQSSAHYFQRPDADYVTLDPTRRSLTGWTGSLNLAKNSGKHWLWTAAVSAESPEFELNDVGILGAADDIDQWWNLRYRDNTPGRVFRSYTVGLYGNNGWNFGGIRQYSNVELYSNLTWANWYSSEIFFGVDAPSHSDNLTRGGPSVGTPFGWWFGTGTWNNFSAQTRYGAFVYGNHNDWGSWYYELETEFSTRGRRWSFSVEPGYSRNISRRQYISPGDSLIDGSPDTYGKRYLFGSIEQSELSAEIRINYFFTPDLSLELYAEPFAASGRYFRFGELPAADSRDIRVYGTDGTTITGDGEGNYHVTDDGVAFDIERPDFGFRSFRSNVVMRWEFRRGSTLFLVWQQNRWGEEEPGLLISPRDVTRSLSAAGDNFLALKIAYWIPVS